MTRGDAITILDCERPYGSCGCGATDEEIEEALNMAIEALEQEPKPGWIPVGERLPEVGIDVLICDMERNIYLSHRSSFGSYFDDWGNKIKDIRAWMPLPEPYTAEGSEAE